MPRYLNTDLDLIARFDFSLLHEELKAAGLDSGLLQEGEGIWRCGYNAPAHGDPDGAISLFLDVIEKLGREARQQWDSCSRRRFDPGIQCVRDPGASRWEIGAEVLSRMAAVGGSLVMTIYCCTEGDDWTQYAEEELGSRLLPDDPGDGCSAED
jgi:hypothetical protein